MSRHASFVLLGNSFHGLRVVGSWNGVCQGPISGMIRRRTPKGVAFSFLVDEARLPKTLSNFGTLLLLALAIRARTAPMIG